MATSTETMVNDQSAFEYDYETLRTTGVILAVVMFVTGILIALIIHRFIYRHLISFCLLLAQVLWNGFSPAQQKCLLSRYRD
ncbi:FXYD domain containing ion transport regulator 7 isoform X1 [Hemibagrus wyckioides]|uniref:FXYD domain containing ion transport regulator 7 isoform X1 n=1 Tax=Hemibagrus wyckioides TaxID=337641 RepID=UPI00266D8DA4|nr:FXYD domain containing ion transport regulator 7 isoform X1 [Hemibagrus wyckioides]